MQKKKKWYLMKEMNGGIKKKEVFNQQPEQYGLMGVFAGNLEL